MIQHHHNLQPWFSHQWSGDTSTPPFRRNSPVTFAWIYTNLSHEFLLTFVWMKFLRIRETVIWEELRRHKSSILGMAKASLVNIPRSLKHLRQKVIRRGIIQHHHNLQPRFNHQWFGDTSTPPFRRNIPITYQPGLNHIIASRTWEIQGSKLIQMPLSFSPSFGWRLYRWQSGEFSPELLGLAV